MASALRFLIIGRRNVSELTKSSENPRVLGERAVRKITSFQRNPLNFR